MRKGDKLSAAEAVQRQMLTGVLEMLVLELLTDKDLSPSQVKVKIESKHADLKLSDQTMFNLVYRLLERSYLSVVSDKFTGKLYRIEPAGREYLELLNCEYDQLSSCVNEIRRDNAKRKK